MAKRNVIHKVKFVNALYLGDDYRYFLTKSHTHVSKDIAVFVLIAMKPHTRATFTLCS